MPTNRQERIKKQLQKLINQKNIQDNSLTQEYKVLIKFILSNKVFLNKFDIEEENLSDNDEENYNLYHQKCLSRLTTLTKDDFETQELNEIDKEIVRNKNTIKQLETEKFKIISITNKYRDEYIKEPHKLINKIRNEENNLYQIIERINDLEERDNNEFVDNYFNLLEHISIQQNVINEKKRVIRDQEQKLIEFTDSNIRARKKTIDKIYQQKINLKKQNMSIDKTKNYQKEINVKIKNLNHTINNLKLKIIEINRLGIFDNEFDTRESAINHYTYQISLNRKKLDYFIKEDNKQRQIINKNIEQNIIELDKPKVISKTQYQLQKDLLRTYKSNLGKELKKIDILMKDKVKLIQSNIDNNLKIDKEFQNGKLRLIKICERIHNTFNDNRNNMLTKIGDRNQSLSVLQQKKDNLNLLNKKLLDSKVNFNKDSNFILQHLDNINSLKSAIAKVTTDIKSYQKLI